MLMLKYLVMIAGFGLFGSAGGVRHISFCAIAKVVATRWASATGGVIGCNGLVLAVWFWHCREIPAENR